MGMCAKPVLFDAESIQRVTEVALAFVVGLLYWLQISLALLVLRCEIYWPLGYYLWADSSASCTFPSLDARIFPCPRAYFPALPK